MSRIDYEDIKALIRMTNRGDETIARIAKATLALVEGLRDAEIRAAQAEATLEAQGAKLAAIRSLLAQRRAPGSNLSLALSQMLRDIDHLAA